MADRVRAAEDDVEPASRELALDPLAGETERQQLVMADNTVLVRRQVPNSANWSRFPSSIEFNLDQFGNLRRLHGYVSVWGR